MKGKLINVRLSPSDASKADALKADGVELSQVVRDALRAEYDRRATKRRSGKDIQKILAEVYAKYPLPEDVPALPVDTRDRTAMRKWIRERLTQPPANGSNHRKRPTRP